LRTTTQERSIFCLLPITHKTIEKLYKLALRFMSEIKEVEVKYKDNHRLDCTGYAL